MRCLLKNHQLGSLVGLRQLGDADLEAVEGALEVDPALPLHGVVKVADVLRLLILLAILQRFFQNTFFVLLKKTCMNTRQFFQFLHLAYRNRWENVWKERKLLGKRHEISTNLRCLHLGGAEDIPHGGLPLPPPRPAHQPHLEPELGRLLGAPLGPALGGGGAAADGHTHRPGGGAGLS